MTHDAATTAKVRRVWDRQAKAFDRQMAFWERRLFDGDREWACGQARGDVLEVAVGTGRNLEHYPPEVRLVGIDLSSDPGGALILAEHVGSPNRWVRAVQWLIHQITYRLAHEHQLRRPYTVVLETDLEPTHHERRKAGIVERLVARRPAKG